VVRKPSALRRDPCGRERLRFSYRDVEELLAKRWVEISYETVQL
jgi:hypothetical protein